MIQLLPEHVSNQIAAGEVIQRPSSAVKELLENAIDASSTKIQLVVKDAGSTLIQVIDNGIGMNKQDAILCFKKHATSKIKSADDLFNISSKGFRGEALSTIAAVAQVELKTRTSNNDTGYQVIIEGSKIIGESVITTPIGSSISMKNLFFNIPARRNFLKSNGVETRHIIDEFQRVAMAHPEVNFSMYNNDQLTFDLPAGNRRQRIVSIFGKKYNERLVPVEEKTSITSISGFILKPEFSKRTRGEQFLFINNRFIKSSSINHAINFVFKDLISKDHFPSYFLYIDVPPNSIDVNIHPTKTEIKFEDERAIYTMVKSCVRSSLGKYNVAPTIDFEQENSFNIPPINSGTPISAPTIKVNTDYNPFKQKPTFNVEENLELLRNNFQSDFNELENISSQNSNDSKIEIKSFLQFKNRYLISIKKNGILLVDIFRAHQQIKFEDLITNYQNSEIVSQQLLHPIEVNLSNIDMKLCIELKEDLLRLGVEIDQFSKDTVVINSYPVNSENLDAQGFIETCIENFKNENLTFENPYQKLAWGLATNYAHSRLVAMENKEMAHLIDCLFSCQSPTVTAHGLAIIKEINETEIVNKFN
jgi:DNA mismatch repair protein MutL